MQVAVKDRPKIALDLNEGQMTVLIRPGYQEIIARKAKSIIDEENRNNERKLMVQKKDNWKKHRKEMRETLQAKMVEWTREEAKRLKVSHLLDKLDDEALMLMQEKTLERVIQNSDKSFWKMFWKSFVEDCRINIAFSIAGIFIFSSIAFIALGLVDGVISGFAYFLKLINPYDLIIGWKWLAGVSPLCPIAMLFYEIFQNTRERIGIIKRLKRLKNLGGKYLLPIDQLRKKLVEA